MMLKFDRRWILLLIVLNGFIIRLFSAVKHEAILHEYDPYFNYRCTEYLIKYGPTKFWNFYDDGSWYPLGRRVGQTVYPGLMLTVYVIHGIFKYIGLDIEIKYICVYLPVFFSILTVLAAYKLSLLISNSVDASLFSAFFISVLPSYISRSVAGSFDNEAISIFLMVASFCAWLYSVEIGSISASILAATCTWLMATSWGGYIFVINIISLFTITSILLNVSGKRCCIAFIVYHLFTSLLCFCVPVIGNNIFSMEHKTTHLTLLIALSYLFITSIGRTYHKLFAIPLILSPALAAYKLNLSKVSIRLSQRVISLLDPTHIQKYNPLVASISEHQPTKWTSLLLDFWVTLVYMPIGICESLRGEMRPGNLFLIIYGIVALYFAAAMIRLTLLLGPSSAILSGIGVSFLLRRSFNNLKSKWSWITIIFLALSLISNVLHTTWTSCVVYSNPNIMISWRDAKGNRVVADDFRNAYAWVRTNTDQNAIIMAWWDYGYQLKQLTNRTILTDNNTCNTEQIAHTAMIFASTEEDAHNYLKELNVDYVMATNMEDYSPVSLDQDMITFGGLSRYTMDDVSKFPWMVRIASSYYPHLHMARFITNKGLYSGDNYNWQETLLYKLCYFNANKVTKVDKVRNTPIGTNDIQLTHFTEVYTSNSWIVRIYKIN